MLLFRWFVAALLLILTPVPASVARAEPRVALVVGNGAYDHVGALENPANDARLMAASLTTAGFDVTLLVDANRTDFERSIREFGRKLRADPETTGLFYFAGHGVQSFGMNFLLPVDTLLTNQADLELIAIEARAILRQMYTAGNKTNIVILDSCRENPFEAVLGLTDNGLAEMRAPTGTFLSYATAPGMVAYDGFGNNSPFSRALASEVLRGDQPIEQVFKNVRVAVLEETGGEQTTWDTSSLTTDFRFSASEPLTDAELEEQLYWRSVKAAEDPFQAMLFLRAYPNSKFAAEARRMVQATLGGQPKPITPPEPAEQPAPAPLVADEEPQNEQELLAHAQAAGTIEAYQAYLDRYPDGVFVELAKMEVAALQKDAATDPVGRDAPEEQRDEGLQVGVAGAALDPTASTAIAFDTVLTGDDPNIGGRTIGELAQGMPLHPPIEGLPEAVWKGQTCANCHNWTKEALCDQGNFYVDNQATRNIGKLHPYGGSFKQHLRQWAASGCN